MRLETVAAEARDREEKLRRPFTSQRRRTLTNESLHQSPSLSLTLAAGEKISVISARVAEPDGTRRPGEPEQAPFPPGSAPVAKNRHSQAQQHKKNQHGRQAG